MTQCICPECPKHNWNPWTPSQLEPEKAAEVHNEMYHDGDSIAHVVDE